MPTIIVNFGSSIVGCSVIPGYEGKVEALGFRHEILFPVSWREGFVRMRGECSQHGDFIVTRLIDKATPKIYHSFLTNETLSEVEITTFKHSGTGLVAHMCIHLRNVRVTCVVTETETIQHPQTGEMTDRVLEHVALNYDAIYWRCGGIMGSWDLQARSVISPTS